MNVQSLVGKSEVKIELEYDFNDASYIRSVYIKNGQYSIFFRPRMIRVAERREIGVIDIFLENEIDNLNKYCLTMNGSFIGIKSSKNTKFHINDNNYTYAHMIMFDNCNIYVIPSSLPEYISISISSNSDILRIGSFEYDFIEYYFD